LKLSNADHSWYHSAACRGAGPALFYPERGERATPAEALAICAGCSVRSDCLTAALTEEHRTTWRFGVRAGLTAAQRSALGRRASSEQSPVEHLQTLAVSTRKR
jgi:WhiB family redox-sensing transcriptional regulator